MWRNQIYFLHVTPTKDSYLPDIIDWLWAKVTWSLYTFVYAKLQNHPFGFLEPQREETEAASLYVLGRGIVCFTYHETRDKCVVNILFASYKGQIRVTSRCISKDNICEISNKKTTSDNINKKANKDIRYFVTVKI